MTPTCCTCRGGWSWDSRSNPRSSSGSSVRWTTRFTRTTTTDWPTSRKRGGSVGTLSTPLWVFFILRHYFVANIQYQISNIRFFSTKPFSVERLGWCFVVCLPVRSVAKAGVLSFVTQFALFPTEHWPPINHNPNNITQTKKPKSRLSRDFCV